MMRQKEIWIPFLLFLFLSLLLLLGYALPIDLWIYQKIIIVKPITNLMKIFTLLGEPQTIFILSLLWIIYLFKKNRSEIKPFCFLLLISTLLMILLKLLFARNRPDILRLIPITGYSFPSGHSIFSVAFYGYLFTYYLEQHSRKTVFLFLTLTIILGIGFSRIYLGVHYFSDVLAGYSLGFLSLGISNLLRRKEE